MWLTIILSIDDDLLAGQQWRLAFFFSESDDFVDTLVLSVISLTHHCPLSCVLITNRKDELTNLFQWRVYKTYSLVLEGIKTAHNHSFLLSKDGKVSGSFTTADEFSFTTTGRKLHCVLFRMTTMTNLFQCSQPFTVLHLLFNTGPWKRCRLRFSTKKKKRVTAILHLFP